MNRGLGIALLAVGIVLMVFGLNSSDSISSSFSRFFTGHPTDKAMWLLLGGLAATVVGGIATLKPSKS
jgi:hypothetical protein